jgi:uncharacterized membrane protein
MNKEQLEQWFKGMADGFFGGLNYTMENTTTVAIASVVVLLFVLFPLFGLLAKAARKRRQKKDERATQREIDAHYE